ncbi:ADP-ribosylglycohydrolase family protein [bacterium]|nr:MAG: ADP-ribosylglycohydrolase family protein [bacterium]
MKPTNLQPDYAERVYAGVLGKAIGVYLGRPFEGWSYRAITERFVTIDRYVHEDLGVPLVVADDDLSGTFTFIRALEDSGFPRSLDPKAVGDAWLNYLIEGRTVLWWGGMGHSAEHTAYLRLKHGVLPPESGSIALNGPIVAQQIGAQIFIDGWGLLCPGDPIRAAELARAAAVVSHDGEAVIAAQVVAAMVAATFVAHDVDTVLDVGLSLAPADSLIAELGREVRDTERQGLDWREAFLHLSKIYNYERYGGGCHVIPNHALILLALAHGQGDFDKSLEIVNTLGWDTDCNSGNVGCILGVLNGLSGIDRRWRDPVADRLLLPTADGGRCATDCVREALAIVRMATSLTSEGSPRFSFPFPGSVQGFTSTEANVSNVDGRLRITASGPATVTTPTFLAPEELKAGGYGLMASPTLYPGQTVHARVAAVGAPFRASLVIRVYGADDALFDRQGPTVLLNPGPGREIEWKVPDLDGRAIAAVGFRLEGAGTLDVESLDWTGEPETVLGPTEGGTVWKRAWVNGLSELYEVGGSLRAIQNQGTGLAFHGTREWQNLSFSATFVPTLASSFGLAVRAQGMRRYVAALVEEGHLRLVRVTDGERVVLAETRIEWRMGEARELRIAAQGSRFFAKCGEIRLQADDERLGQGAVAIVVTEGRIDCSDPRVRNLAPTGQEST